MHTARQDDTFGVIYEDEWLVAIHKPAGLLVHRSEIDKREREFALQWTRDRIGQRVYPVHRLDKATSGCLLLAKSSAVAHGLQQTFVAGQVQKTYHAIVRGWSQAQGTVDKALSVPYDKKYHRHVSAAQHAQAAPQTAITHYQTLATATLNMSVGKYPTARYSYVKITPETGRQHQIRRHFNRLAHPIIGDVNYGDRHHNHAWWHWLGQHRLYLAATVLSFPHPQTAQAVCITCDLESSFLRAKQTLDWVPIHVWEPRKTL